MINYSYIVNPQALYYNEKKTKRDSMEHSSIREPKQKRSVEKKKRIIQAAYILFIEKGYHNTNTVEIAHYAEVSTGTVYSYFKDKKAIFMDVLDYYAKSIIGPVYAMFEELQPPIRLEDILGRIIDSSLEAHTAAKAAHDEIMAMSFQDDDVRHYVMEFEEKVVLTLAGMLDKLGFKVGHAHEKVHIAFNMIESYCHERVYHQHEFIDYSIMKQQIIQVILSLIGDQGEKR